MNDELVAPCGKKGFKTVQGLQGHVRMCEKCRAMSVQKGKNIEKKKRKECEHRFRVLSRVEKEMRNSAGQKLGDMYVAVCDICGELR